MNSAQVSPKPEEKNQQNYVVTGSSSGICLATAQILVEQGYRVFGSVRTRQDADRLQELLGHNFEPVIFDVTDEAAIVLAAEAVKNIVGHEGLHGLVNCAGISISGPISEVSSELMRRHFEINVMGAFHTIQAFLPLLKI